MFDALGLTFQNILCYCLTKHKRLYKVSSNISKHPMLLFNESGATSISQTIKFQNILCYCLTYFLKKQKASKAKFQNILCYCLTTTFNCSIWLEIISKHPMLLFNMRSRLWRIQGRSISKHPMLLFNDKSTTKPANKRIFQNILCYCLTIW